MAERTIFDPCWLFNAQGRMELVEQSARYQQLLGEGWKDSPVAFGIETHPALPHQPVLQTISGPVADLVVSTQVHQHLLKEFEGTILQMQTTLEEVQALQDAQVRMMQECLATLGQVQTELGMANAAHQRLHQRLTAVEQAVTDPPPEKPQPSGRKP